MEKVRIPIGGSWQFYDLYEFPHTFSQLYYLVYALENAREAYNRARYFTIFTSYPWRGGYSAVNFYNNLYHATPGYDRIKLVSIQYASPGFLELAAAAGIISQIKTMLVAASDAGRHLNETYSQIQKGIHDRKLNKIKRQEERVKLEILHQKFIQESSKTMAKLMDLDVDRINDMTESPFITLKIVLSIYRRLRKLKTFERTKKVKLKELQIEKK
jgi:hypothetical protein